MTNYRFTSAALAELKEATLSFRWVSELHDVDFRWDIEAHFFSLSTIC